MNTLNEQALSGALEARYDVGFSQNVADQIKIQNSRDIQFLDIKELNDLIAEYRTRIRALIAVCRSQENNTTVRQVYASYERIFSRRQIADLWTLYRTAQADCLELTASYMARLNYSGHKTSLYIEKKERAAA